MFDSGNLLPPILAGRSSVHEGLFEFSHRIFLEEFALFLFEYANDLGLLNFVNSPRRNGLSIVSGRVLAFGRFVSNRWTGVLLLRIFVTFLQTSE